MYYTLFDFLDHTKGMAYVLAFTCLVLFVPFFLYLTDREERD